MLLRVLLLLQAIKNPAFTQVDHPGARPDLKAQLSAACVAVPGGERKTLLKNELAYAFDVRARPPQVEAWWRLGCARALLWVDGAIAHDGPLMIAGNSWAQGSAHAMLEQLRLHPTDARAANVLAMLSLDQAEPDPLKGIATSLIAIVKGGATSPAILRACSEFAFRIGDAGDTYACARIALKAGLDSTWHLMRLARLGFRDHDTVGSSRLFARAVSAAHDSMTRLEVDWHLQWFLSPDERTTWGTLPDTARGSFVIDRLASRDVRDGRPAGARLAEHFKRLEYVETHYRLRVPKIIKKQMLTGVSTVSSDTTSLAFRNYNRWQIDFDDQGVVWMRFGEPEKVALDTLGESLIQRETWRYIIDGQVLLISFYDEDFDGSVGASKLSVGMLGAYMCAVDTWRCILAMGNPNPADIERMRQQDVEYITAATQKDDNSVRDDAKQLRIVSNLHRLWDPVSGDPVALVTWALRLDDLAIQESDTLRTATVHLDLRRWDPSTSLWNDTSFVRHLIIPDKNARRSSVTGFVVLPSTAGVTSWSMVATQSEKRRGRAWDDGTPLSSAPLALSDLVLGAESEGLVWNNRGAAIPLAPLDAVNRKETVQLYYQVKSRVERPQLKTTIALYRVDEAGKTATEAALQVAYSDGVHAGLTEVAPLLDVSQLDKGSYRLEVRVQDESGKMTAMRTAMLNLD